MLMEELKNIGKFDLDNVKIYVDMDGVLVNFEKGLNDILDEPYDKKRYNTDSKYKSLIWKSISKFQKDGGNFWEQLSKMNDADQLWNYVKKYDNVEILTATGNPKYGSGEQKKKWIKQNISNNVKVNLVRLSKDKAQFADEDSILIDDQKKSIEPWEQAGGIGILHTDAESTIRKLRQLGV